MNTAECDAVIHYQCEQKQIRSRIERSQTSLGHARQTIDRGVHELDRRNDHQPFVEVNTASQDKGRADQYRKHYQCPDRHDEELELAWNPRSASCSADRDVVAIDEHQDRKHAA